jgi:type I restriction enzyme M protein
MLNNETKRHIDNARDILVGKLPDPKSQIEQITFALIYKFMDDMDKASEAMGGKAAFFTGGYEKYAWDKLMSPKLGGSDRLNLYMEAIIKFSENPRLPQLFRNIFKDAFLPYRDPETLNLFLKEISWFAYNQSGDLGDAFEHLLSIMGSQGEAGQFLTPRHIIDFIVEIIDPKKGETVLDPACGTAGFLISVYKHILRRNTKEKPSDMLTSDEKDNLVKQFTGYDISPDMVRLSLVNMYLHGFQNPNISEYDTLTYEERWDEYYDVIMANPPFMTPKGGIRPHKRFAVQANRSEVLFVDYIAEHLTASGRAGVIVPEGIIFQSANAYKALRKMLVDNYLFAVVSLPAGVFNPYSGVKTSILLMDKALAKKTDKILFVKIENDGFDLGAQRKPIEQNDLPEALAHIKEYLNSLINGKGFILNNIQNILIIDKKQISENSDYNLSLERYRKEEAKLTKWRMVELENIAEINPKKSTLTNVSQDTTVSFVPMSDLNENKIDFLPKEIRKLKDVYSGYTYFQNNDVIIARVTPCFENGKSGIADNLENGIGFGSSEFTVIRAKENVLPEWIYLNVATDKFREYAKVKMTGTGGLQRVPNKVFAFYRIPLPPLDIQQEIVKEIEDYQNIIDGARQVVENYKPRIEIDPEWPQKLVGETCTLITGGTPSTSIKEYYENGTIRWLVSGDIHQGEIFDCKNRITQKGLENSNARWLPVNSVLIALNGQGKTRGTVALLMVEATCSQSIVSINPNNHNELMPEFLYYQLMAKYQDIRNITGDNQRSGLNMPIIRGIRIFLPDINIQQKIVHRITEELKLVNANKELITIFEQKIRDRITRIWGEDK